MLEWQNCLRAGGHPGQREPAGYYEITTIPLLLYGAFLFVYSIGGTLDLHDEKAAACSVRYDLERAKLTSNSFKGRGHFWRLADATTLCVFTLNYRHKTPVKYNYCTDNERESTAVIRCEFAWLRPG